MPAIIASIPDKDVGPIVQYLAKVREELGDYTATNYNDFLLCLLIVGLGFD